MSGEQLTPEQIERIRAVCKTHARFETESWKILALLDALEKISAIRDGIVGMQGFHFSNHAYPLVAALDAVGFPGAGYEIARKNLGTLLDLAESAWGVIANASGGNWDLQADDWKLAAARWRDRYHELIGVEPATSSQPKGE